MLQLQQGLEVRLSDLAKGFEEATVDKNNQHKKTSQMTKMLDTASRFRKVHIFSRVLLDV